MDEKINKVQKSSQDDLMDQQKEGVEISDDSAALSAGGLGAGDVFDYAKMRELKEEELINTVSENFKTVIAVLTSAVL